MEHLLDIRDLSIQFVSGKRIVRAVNGVSLSIDKGQTVGLVGETGAGKTTTALGIMKLVPLPAGRITGGQVFFDGEDLLQKSEQDMRKIRGNRISMIFQDPMTSLNPVFTVGDQIAEGLHLHTKLSAAEASVKAQDMLELVGIPRTRYGDYPHQFSGGMKQRVVIAMALACSPQLLIADEPTTALDVTIQAQVLHLMQDLKTQFDTSMLLITHDLGVVAEVCDSVAIMYAGEIVESGRLEHIYKNAGHPYTKGLFLSLPSIKEKVERLTPIRGMMPDPANLPQGCPFMPRCDRCTEVCRTQRPAAAEVEPGHLVKCHHYRQEV